MNDDDDQAAGNGFQPHQHLRLGFRTSPHRTDLNSQPPKIEHALLSVCKCISIVVLRLQRAAPDHLRTETPATELGGRRPLTLPSATASSRTNTRSFPFSSCLCIVITKKSFMAFVCGTRVFSDRFFISLISSIVIPANHLFLSVRLSSPNVCESRAAQPVPRRCWRFVPASFRPV